jgi:hypothetical protein
MAKPAERKIIIFQQEQQQTKKLVHFLLEFGSSEKDREYGGPT